MILIDTQILVWATTSAEPAAGVQRRAARTFETLQEEGVLVSAISAWEVALKLQRGHLAFRGTTDDWLAAAKGVPFLSFLPVTPEIALASETKLADWPHRDPADRFILATAMTHGLRLLTSDEKLLAFGGPNLIPLDAAG